MKLTKARLKRIIKEEIEKTIRLREATPGSGLRALQPSAPGAPDDDYEEEEESPIEAMVSRLIEDPWTEPFGTVGTWVGADLDSFADAVDMTSQEVYEWRTNLPEGHSIRYYVSIDDPAEVHEPQIRISHPANV
jgi:hypothetical protein|tara:strand:- start:463 stop:864 length:402 start_codon:yes stop_codon:yes gene_type:complete